MKKALHSYTTFTRKESVGIVVLGALILLLLATKQLISILVHPAYDTKGELAINEAYQSFLRAQPVPDTLAANRNRATHEPTSIAPTDLNKADSATLVAIEGIGPVTAHKILAYRQLHGPFAHVDALKNIKGLGAHQYERIAPFFYVDSTSAQMP